MSDLISRQAAIDAADRADYTGLAIEYVKKVTDEVVKELKQLPSAHPELDEWCTECKEYDHEKHNCPRYNRVIREAIEEIQERKKGTWLPIIETNEFGEPYQAGVYCSRCGHQTVYEPNFCPDCGSYNGDKNEV